MSKIDWFSSVCVLDLTRFALDASLSALGQRFARQARQESADSKIDTALWLADACHMTKSDSSSRSPAQLGLGK